MTVQEMGRLLIDFDRYYRQYCRPGTDRAEQLSAFLAHEIRKLDAVAQLLNSRIMREVKYEAFEYFDELTLKRMNTMVGNFYKRALREKIAAAAMRYE